MQKIVAAVAAVVTVACASWVTATDSSSPPVGIDRADLPLLTPGELSTDPLELWSVKRPFKRQRYLPPKVTAKGAYATYVDNANKPVEPDARLSAPRITIESTGERPVVSIPKRFRKDGTEAIYYFEFDTSPTFDSPNFWRYPMLVPGEFVDDVTSRQGIKFRLLRTTHQKVDGRENRLTFPFRASAMRLPGWSELTFEEMQRQARALAYGLAPEDQIREVFAYVRQLYPWASDTRNRTAFETFTSGLGECGHVNNLVGALLEMNGIRYRGVGGFSPKARAALHGNGGHSAIEVLNPSSGKWSYVDSYLDLLAMDVSAEDFDRSDLGKTPIYSMEKYGWDKWVTLTDLFTYRTYWDKLGRGPFASMLRLEDSSQYGKGWPPNIAPEYPAAEIIPASVTIHVRARYGFARGGVSHVREPHGTAGPIRLSPWATTSFTIAPQDMLAKSDG